MALEGFADNVITRAEAEQYPLVGSIEPYTQAARRIEVRRSPDNVAVVIRFDNKNGETPLAWFTKDRTPEWFMENNLPKRWTLA